MPARASESILAETGIPSRQLAIETIEFPFDLTLELAETLDLSLCLDTGHVLVGFSGPVGLVEALERCLPRLAEIHLHDGPWQGPGAYHRLRPGSPAPGERRPGHRPTCSTAWSRPAFAGPIIFELTRGGGPGLAGGHPTLRPVLTGRPGRWQEESMNEARCAGTTTSPSTSTGWASTCASGIITPVLLPYLVALFAPAGAQEHLPGDHSRHRPGRGHDCSAHGRYAQRPQHPPDGPAAALHHRRHGVQPAVLAHHRRLPPLPGLGPGRLLPARLWGHRGLRGPAGRHRAAPDLLQRRPTARCRA